VGKPFLQNVGQRNGMNVKTVQRYLWLNDLVPELKEVLDAGKLSFTPAGNLPHPAQASEIYRRFH